MKRFTLNTRRFVAIVLAAMMVLSMVPVVSAEPEALPSNAAAKYEGADPATLDLGVINFDYNWLHYKPEVHLGPYYYAGTDPVAKSLEAQQWMRDHDPDGLNRNFYDVDYPDSDWEKVSLPHTINDVDAYTGRGSDSNGEQNIYTGVFFYRKHFKLPESYRDKKIFIEFEGVRQSAYVYLNGKIVGFFESSICSFGFDLSDCYGQLNFGDKENVISVAVDNRGVSNGVANRPVNNNLFETKYGNEPGYNDGTVNGGHFATYTSSTTAYASNLTPGEGNGVSYQWNYNRFNPVQGGITKNVFLHIKSKTFQTLPLYANLQTQGTYVYANNFDIPGKTATINIESEVRNEDADKNITMEVVLVDKDGAAVGSFSKTQFVPKAKDIAKNADVNWTTVRPNAYNYVSGGTTGSYSNSGLTAETLNTSGVGDSFPLPDILNEWRDNTMITASADFKDLNWWKLDDPYLYDVYCLLKDESGKTLDTRKITTGFRKVEFKGTEGKVDTGGVFINEEYKWLPGYAQRSSCDWAAIGVGTDWINDFDMQLVRDSSAYHIRWMHIAPPPSAMRATDKFGIVATVPAGDLEGDPGVNINTYGPRRWAQRVEMMRNVIILYRNHPSAFMWEVGNDGVTNNRLHDMRVVKEILAPMSKSNTALTSRNEAYGNNRFGTVESENIWLEANSYMLGRKEQRANFSTVERTSEYVAFFEAEANREEASRRMWDRYTRPLWASPNEQSYGFTFYHNYGGGEGQSGTSTYSYNSSTGLFTGGNAGSRDCFDYTAEEHTVSFIDWISEYYNWRVYGNPDPNKSVYSGFAFLCWSDSDQHCRQGYSENARMSGRVDSVRIKKQNFYAIQAALSPHEPKIYLMGHWDYETPISTPTNDIPRQDGDPYWYRTYTWSSATNQRWPDDSWAYRDPLQKKVYAVASIDVDHVKLFIDGVEQTQTQARRIRINELGSLTANTTTGIGYGGQAVGSIERKNNGETSTQPYGGANSREINNFLWCWDGGIPIYEGNYAEAKGYDAEGKELCSYRLNRTSEPAGLKVTTVTGPDGFRADGSDICFFDVEVIDSNGNVCPVSYDKININVTGDVYNCGAYNSGVNYTGSAVNAINNVDQYQYTLTHDRNFGGYNRDYIYAECGVNRLFLRAGQNAGPVSVTFSMDLDGLPYEKTVYLESQAVEVKDGLSNVFPQVLSPETPMLSTENYLWLAGSVNVSVSTPKLVEDHAANLKVTVSDLVGVADDAVINIAYAGVSKTIVGAGDVILNVPAVTMADNKVVATVDGVELGSAAITVVENKNIWDTALSRSDNDLLIQFNAVIGCAASSFDKCISVDANGAVTAAACVTEIANDSSAILIKNGSALLPTPEAKIIVKSVKFVELFPSYSFTFTVTL